ncbi:sporadic carbohydrate cluster protein, LIC12192 family [Alphaproteobacteria bacterium]|nr:sporadic carbohydrate cluster protein, LIC12192 family [Alphaproteobacteria bacterium]
MYRGYLSSRPFMGERVPQHIQNQIIRQFCINKNLHYLLSMTEYAMKDSYLILSQLLEEINSINGIVFYSLFQLPTNNKFRAQCIDICLNNNKKFFFAVENLEVNSVKDIEVINNIWNLKKIIGDCPKIININ